MERLWTPWRLEYVTGAASNEAADCVFCEVCGEDAPAPLLLYRGACVFVILNKYPYNNGHLMVVPFRHIGRMADANSEELGELIRLVRISEMVLTEAYQAHGSVGHRLPGKVVSLTDYGAFIELEPGVEGLIHVSEMSWSKRIKHPSKLLNVGDTVESMILAVDSSARRISLGLKQTESNPWQELEDKYPVGTKLTGTVRNLTEFGAFVEIDDGIDGLIHISDMSWSKRLKHPSDVLEKGDEVEAMVLNIDSENQRLSLGLKQLATDIWDDFFSNTKVGDVVEGKIVRITNFGAFVELGEGIEGLIHVSEFENQTGSEDAGLKVDETINMRVIKLSPEDRKIGLSIRALSSDDFETDWQSYASSDSPEVTLGDHFKQQTSSE